MPPIRSTALERCTLFIISISLNGEIMSPCSCYIKKGLVCIIFISPSGCQPSSYLKCTKVNT
jgi:hypothetical protein